jgi:hypothetical protein
MSIFVNYVAICITLDIFDITILYNAKQYYIITKL